MFLLVGKLCFFSKSRFFCSTAYWTFFSHVNSLSIDLITLDVSLLTVSKTGVALVLVVSVDLFIAASLFYIACTVFVCCIMLLNFWRPMMAFKQDGIFFGIFMVIGIYFSTHTLRFPVIGLISRLYHNRKCSTLFIFSKIISKKCFYVSNVPL